MSILVDEARWPWRGRLWAHLVSDHAPGELHEFARRLGKRRLSFQGDHYDIDAADRRRALDLGAEPVESRDLVRRLRAAGLRHRGASPGWARLDDLTGGPAASTVVATLEADGERGARMAAALGRIDLAGAATLEAPEGGTDRVRTRIELAAFVGDGRLAVLIEVPAGSPRPDVGALFTEPVNGRDQIEVVVGEPRPDGSLSIELFGDR